MSYKRKNYAIFFWKRFYFVLWRKLVTKLGGCKWKESTLLVMLRHSLCKYVI